ncbi:hypothetical protein INR49_006918 [Caranx melampygus]|nr:hypothetical protein INR49_006918 [Caranx melampygus]
MAPTRMKLRVRRRDGAGAAGGGQPTEEEERSREGGGGRSSSRRKNNSNTSTTAAAAAAAAAASSPPTSSASASVRAVVAAEETSPDSKCPICLDRFNNLAYLDRCLHRFCFPCIQEWSHNKAECPLCKQPFASILHSVRAEDDFKEYTLRPAPANSSVAATVAMRMRGGADLAERGVIFEGLTGLGGAGSVAPNDRASRRLMTRLAARQRLQREGGTVRRLRERETVAFRRALYRCSIRVRGVAGVNGNQGQHRDITAESFRRNPTHLNRLRPWLRRELTVLYGAHGTLVDIVQRIIMARLARHGLEDTPTIEEELRPFLLARTDHFLHELVSFARSPLNLENYDLQAVYEPPAATLELDGTSSPSDSSSVIAISEGEEEEEENRAGGRSEERLQGRAGSTFDDVIQTGSSLSLSAWDDETPGPSYSTAEPSCSITSLSFSPDRHEPTNEEAAEKCEEEGEEDSGRSHESVCTLSADELRQESWRDRKQCGGEAAREKRRKKRKRRGRERSGTLYNPNRSIYPAMMRRRSHSPSPFYSSVESGSPLPPSPPDSSWEYHCSPFTSSVSSPSRSSSSSSPLGSSPQPPSSPPPQTPPTPSLSRETLTTGKNLAGKESTRRSREDRSPSVEIIYEGTITSDATQPPARKRRRKRHRKTLHNSSPVIITLDSDSSHDDVNNKNSSGSSSPLSSQQTVDFSDLPPLPLVHSAGIGGALDGEIGELPVDILDRGSDGSETEPAGQSGPIAIDNSDNSDDVDVENIEESDSLLAWSDDKGRSSSSQGPTREGDRKTITDNNPRDVDAQRRGNGDSAPGPTSDSCLLATILNDLKDITVPKCDPPLNFEARYSPDTRRKRLQDPCEANRACSNQSAWLAEMRNPVADWPAEQHSDDVRGQNQRLDYHTSTLSPPSLQQPRERQVRRDGVDIPPLLKKASPVRSHNRNTPPPLKHKDAGSPHLSPAGLRSPHASVDVDPVGVNNPLDLNPNPATSHVDSHVSPEMPKDHQAIPPISTLKKPFISALASSTSSSNKASSCHLAPIDSHLPDPSQARDLTTEIHSTTETGWSKEKQLGLTLPLEVAPVDLHLSSSVSAGSTPAGSGVFSGVHSNNTSPAVLASSFGSRTQYPSSPIDSRSSSKGEYLSQRPTFNSVPTTAPSDRSSPTDLHPQSHKSTLDPHSSSAASEGPNDADVSIVNHKDRSPHGHQPTINLHCTSPSPPAHLHSSRIVTTVIDGLSNHAALPPPPTLHTPHRKCSSRAEPAVDRSDSKHHNHFNAGSNPRFPVDTNSTHNSPTDSQCESKPPVNAHSKSSRRDFQLHTDNHMTPFPESNENQWNSADAHSDSQSPIDERSTSSVLATHTHSAT